MALSAVTQLKKQKALEVKKKKAQTDLGYLITEILDCEEKPYNLFTKEWHGPLCDWRSKNNSHSRIALFAPRMSYKSTYYVMACILQDILNDPDVAIFLIHHKLEFACELVTEVAWHLRNNIKYRELLPYENRPMKNSKFLKTANGGQFKLPRTHRRHPTLSGTSVGQDFTSTHPDIVYLDDVISEKTIEEQGGFAGIKAWIERTITALLGATGKLRCCGTLWSGNPDEDYYMDIMKPDSGWLYQRKAILENEKGEADWNGKPIHIYVPDRSCKDNRRLLTVEDVEQFKKDAKGYFAGQYMNEPTPKGVRPWDKDTCEHYVTVREVQPHLKSIAILMDPAPLGMDSDGKKMGISGDKNYWAMAVMGYTRSPKGNVIRVLLDGSMSQEWTLDEGMKECRRLMRKWKCRVVGIEEARAHGQNAGLFGLRLIDICKKSPYYERLKPKPVTFKGTQKGKSPRIHDLAALAKLRDFMINSDDNMNPEFLSMFLTQARNWSGKNSIKFDDCIDSVAYLEDAAIKEAIVIGKPVIDDLTEVRPAISSNSRRSRYCGI